MGALLFRKMLTEKCMKMKEFGLRGDASLAATHPHSLGVRAPFSVQFLSFSCSFQQKSCQIMGFCPRLIGWCPLGLGNPGFATESDQSIIKVSDGVYWVERVYTISCLRDKKNQGVKNQLGGSCNSHLAWVKSQLA